MGALELQERDAKAFCKPTEYGDGEQDWDEIVWVQIPSLATINPDIRQLPPLGKVQKHCRIVEL